MNHNSLIILMILGIVFFDVYGNEELKMKCMITEELEKSKPAINKNYTEKDIFIFIDRANLWVSDIPYKNWQNQNKESVGKIEKRFEETEKKYFLIFMNFSKIIRKSLNQALKFLLKNSEVI